MENYKGLLQSQFILVISILLLGIAWLFMCVWASIGQEIPRASTDAKVMVLAVQCSSCVYKFSWRLSFSLLLVVRESSN